MFKKIDISIIIVNFNTKDFLKECLVSIFQSLKKTALNFEVIVVDNGSTDGSAKKIKLLVKEYSYRLVRRPKISLKKKAEHGHQIRLNSQISTLRLIENRTNLGFAKANNRAIKHAKGKYILLLNPDTIIQPKTIPFMIDFMEKNKDVGIATCRVELPSGELDDACHRGFPSLWNAFCHFSGLARLFPQSQLLNGYHLGYQNIDKVHEIDACAGAFLLIRRKVGEEIGWFDEDYFWYGEDLDLCYRVKKAGWKIVFIPQVKIVHYKGVASGIKENSLSLSYANKETKILATNARFDVMKLFYDKHYKQKYPQFVRWFIFFTIEIKRRIAFLKI